MAQITKAFFVAYLLSFSAQAGIISNQLWNSGGNTGSGSGDFPTALCNETLHVQSDDSSTLWADTGATTQATTTVQRWDNLVSGGWSLSEATNPPSIIAAQQNGKQLIAFDGVNDTIGNISLSDTYTQITIFAAMRLEDSRLYRPYIAMNATLEEWQDNQGFSIQSLGNVGGVGVFHWGGQKLESTVNNQNNFNLYVYRIDFANNTASLWVDGVEVDTLVGGTNTSISPTRIRLGSGIFANGDPRVPIGVSIGEVIICANDTYVSAGDRTTYNTYFDDRWAIPGL